MISELLFSEVRGLLKCISNPSKLGIGNERMLPLIINDAAANRRTVICHLHIIKSVNGSNQKKIIFMKKNSTQAVSTSAQKRPQNPFL